MKHTLRFLSVVLLILAMCTDTFATTKKTNGIGGGPSVGGGLWSATTTWADGVVPNSSDSIEIVGVDSITIDIPIIITGTLIKSGTGAVYTVTTTDTLLSFGNGGTYWHKTDGGRIPTSKWGIGSTCLLTGVVAAVPSGNAQRFYNYTYNCSGNTGNMSLGWNGGLNYISGTLTVLNTNSPGTGSVGNTNPTNYLRIFSGSSTTIPNTINNIVLDGSKTVLTTYGSGFATTVNVSGDITIKNGACLSLSFHSGNVGTWNLDGNLSIPDSGYIGKKTNNSNTSIIVFTKNKTHTFSSKLLTIFSAPNFKVDSGATLIMTDTSKLSGSGSFILNPGATLVCANPYGIRTSAGTTGSATGTIGNYFSPLANYIFNGTSAQTTGFTGKTRPGLTGTVNNLTINNAAGVSLDTNITINGTLNMTSGNIALKGDTLTLGSSTSTLGSLVYAAGNMTGLGTFKRWLGSGAISGTASTFPMGVTANSRSVVISGTLTTGGTISVSYTDSNTVSTPFGPSFVENSQTFINRYDANWAVSVADGFVGSDLSLAINGNGLPGISAIGNLNVSGANSAAPGTYAAPTGSTLAPVVNRAGLTESTLPSTYYIASTATSNPKLQLVPKSIAFGNITVGAYKDTVFTISNPGTDTLRISSIVSENSVFSVQITQVILPPSSSIEDTIRFTPALTNSYNSYLLVSSNASSSVDTVFLSGTGLVATVIENALLLPKESALLQNFPNPFNPSTNFTYQVGRAGFVSVKMYDILGREVATLVNEVKQAGTYPATWNAAGFDSGIYFCKMQTGSFVETKKMILVK